MLEASLDGAGLEKRHSFGFCGLSDAMSSFVDLAGFWGPSLVSSGMLVGGSKSGGPMLGEVGDGEPKLCSEEMAALISEDRSE